MVFRFSAHPHTVEVAGSNPAPPRFLYVTDSERFGHIERGLRLLDLEEDVHVV
jgi:hypothetical protein